MLFNPYDLMPIFNVCEKPPTLYSLLESIVNYGKDNKTKIKDLARQGRRTIFDFDYPLSSNINREEFECMILNHFITRRIGFQTPTLFKIQLNVKLNEIMPMYNKAFDMLEGWDIFRDGENITRNVVDSRNKGNTINTTINDTITESNNISGSTETENSLENSSTTETEATSDKRHSDTPQNAIQDVQDGTYVSDYSYVQDENSATDTSESTGSSSSSTETEETKNKTNNSVTNVTGNETNAGNLTETIIKSPADKMKMYREFMENKQSLYSLIFKELECLFLQVY